MQSDTKELRKYVKSGGGYRVVYSHDKIRQTRFFRGHHTVCRKGLVKVSCLSGVKDVSCEEIPLIRGGLGEDGGEDGTTFTRTHNSPSGVASTMGSKLSISTEEKEPQSSSQVDMTSKLITHQTWLNLCSHQSRRQDLHTYTKQGTVYQHS